MLHSRSINSNFDADVLETRAKLGKMLMIFVISISKLTKTAVSDEEVRGAYSDRLLVSFSILLYSKVSCSLIEKFFKFQLGPSGRGDFSLGVGTVRIGPIF